MTNNMQIAHEFIHIKLARWQNSLSGHFVVGRPGLNFFVESYQRFQNVFTSSLLGSQPKKNSVENKSASFFTLSLRIALTVIPSCFCGRQEVRSTRLPLLVADTDKRLLIKNVLIA